MAFDETNVLGSVTNITLLSQIVRCKILHAPLNFGEPHVLVNFMF